MNVTATSKMENLEGGGYETQTSAKNENSITPLNELDLKNTNAKPIQ